ncbi:MAG: glycosyltransferase family 1 protein [Candidatus Uhrbacteria bacterium]|nr:glycosyltransferase family 1 protein [Candidatus Uhrbacteria bacterium]
MRILVDCRHLNTHEQSGVGEYTIQLLGALFALANTHEYILLTSGREAPDLLSIFRSRTSPSFVFPAFVKHTHVPMANKFLNLKLLLMKQPAINWLVKDPIDLVFLPNLNITVLPTSIPTVLTIHDVSWKFFPDFFSRKMRVWHHLLDAHKLIRDARFVITPSNTTSHDVARMFRKSPDEIAAIPHGITSTFHPRMEAHDHGVRSKLKLPKRFALFVGTIEPRKNVLSIIEGVKRYREMTHDDLHLVLVGKWGWKSHNIRRRLWKRDVHDWVHNLEYINPLDLPAIYRSASVFIWPSFYEGFGLPILEAMASGLPVITSNISSMPEVTSSGALHVDPFNIQDIADALKGIISLKPLHEQLKKAGLERATEFSWKKAAEQTLAIFEKSLK